MVAELKNYIGYVIAFAVLAFAYWIALTNESSRRKVVRIFISKLNEQVLYLYSLTAILFLFSDDDLSLLIFYPVTHFENANIVLVPIWLFGMGLLLFGLSLPIYHAFATRRKKPNEKVIMIFFAIAAQVAVGISSGSYALDHSDLLFDMVLATWNIITGVLLVLLLRLEQINQDFIDDKNTQLAPIVLGSVVILCLFYGSHYLYHLYWATGMSLCFIYIQSVHDRMIVALAGSYRF